MNLKGFVRLEMRLLWYLNTPIHSVSSVFVDHILAVESSDPVTNILPSSERAIQLILSSWSAIVSLRTPFLFLVELPLPMISNVKYFYYISMKILKSNVMYFIHVRYKLFKRITIYILTRIILHSKILSIRHVFRMSRFEYTEKTKTIRGSLKGQ